MSFFAPEFGGHMEIARLPDDFTARIKRRVEEGLLVPGRRSRANYHVRSVDGSSIRFAAEGLATIYAVGLNDVTVCRSGRNQIQYQVSYWGWTMAAVVHGLLLGIVMLTCYLFVPELDRQVRAYSYGPAVFWDMVAFWSLLWPWLLARVHRQWADRALQQVLRETLSDPPVENHKAA